MTISPVVHSRRAVAVIGIAVTLGATAACGSGSSGNTPVTGAKAELTFDVVGAAPTQAKLATVAADLRARLVAAGLNTATVKVDGTRIVMFTPAVDSGIGRALGVRGALRFRQMLAEHHKPTGPYDGGEGAVEYGPAQPGSESPTLTAAFLRSFKAWDCTANNIPTGGSDPAEDYIIGCDAQNVAYLLAPAALEGSDVKTAEAALDSQAGTQWVVNIEFTHAGAGRWFAITKKTYEVTGSTSPGSSGFPHCAPPKGCNAIGIVLDGVVASVPATETDGIPGGQSQIIGNFTQQEAVGLAAILTSGQLPYLLHLGASATPR